MMGKDHAVSALCRALYGPDAIGGITSDFILRDGDSPARFQIACPADRNGW